MGDLKCKACVVFCIDFRLHDHLNRFVAERGLDKDGADIVRVAGVAINLARPAQQWARDFVTGQHEASKRLHDVEEIHLVNHEDCGAYGLDCPPGSEEELAVHVEDLRSARSVLEARFHGVKIFTHFLRLDGQVETIE
jgi:carbonic anhydrase